MKEFKIYTCGRMSGISYEEQMKWRNDIEYLIKMRTNKSVTFIHPPLFYGYHEKMHKTEREIKEWELSQICNCDIVIVNVKGISQSIGSHIEIGAIDGANIVGNKHIAVIGIGEPDDTIHPWIDLSFLRYEKDLIDAADYIAKYLLI